VFLISLNSYLGASVADILPFKKVPLKQKFKGHTLCKQGHHKWRIVTERKFDVQQGKLVTAYECERCHKHKTKLL
tara:strand:- start:33972 stop:34196 length:225 start_codon:yes stop_codon:yes gene_type:complete